MIGMTRPGTAFGFSLVGIALLCAIALAPAPATTGTATTSSCAIDAAPQPVSPVSCEATSAEVPAPDDARPPLRGYCQCGCGVRCSTSADCGGAACRPFITCC